MYIQIEVWRNSCVHVFFALMCVCLHLLSYRPATYNVAQSLSLFRDALSISMSVHLNRQNYHNKHFFDELPNIRLVKRMFMFFVLYMCFYITIININNFIAIIIHMVYGIHNESVIIKIMRIHIYYVYRIDVCAVRSNKANNSNGHYFQQHHRICNNNGHNNENHRW